MRLHNEAALASDVRLRESMGVFVVDGVSRLLVAKDPGVVAEGAKVTLDFPLLADAG